MDGSTPLSIRVLQLSLAVCLGLFISIAPVPAELTTLFGPETFVRGKGKPVTYTRDFSVERVHAPFTLHLRNGNESGKHRASSAKVWLNGHLLFGPSHFSQQVSGYDIAVNLTDPSTLEVWIASKPGSTLTLWIEGEPAPQAVIESFPAALTLIPEEPKHLATALSFSATAPATIQWTQTITPATGLTLSPALDGQTLSASGEFATTLMQEVTGATPGNYEVITTATVLGTGASATAVTPVTVTPAPVEGTAVAANAPGAEPAGLSPDTLTPVIFAVQVQGVEPETIMGVDLTELNTARSFALNDAGEDGDLLEDDGAFSGTVTVDTTGMMAGQCLFYQATVHLATDITQALPIHPLCVTSFPTEIATPDTSNLVPDPETGDPAIANEVIISMVNGTPEDRIRAIVAAVGGQVVGSFPGLDIYQVRLMAPVSSTDELATVLTALESFPEVTNAGPHTLDTLATVEPTDNFFSSQDGLKKIRADEAWYIARGESALPLDPTRTRRRRTTTIAIVDTGVDLFHPDLDGKIIVGPNFGDDNLFPDDQHGHGTQVAGIAAAETNNDTNADGVSRGIAGVSWHSKILVVKINEGATAGAARGPAIEGLRYAVDRGVRFINASFGGDGVESKNAYCPIVRYARRRGALVIASAGNDASSVEHYPAACDGAIAVGATTLDDTRRSTSNFGSWVDLAAPGELIQTTDRNKDYTSQFSGTSAAAPFVSGAAAVVLSSRPSLTNSQIENRLKRTAKKLPGQDLGAGRLDLFEAVFNGSFEGFNETTGNIISWSQSGDTSAMTEEEFQTKFGTPTSTIKPQHRERMGFVSTGPAGASDLGQLTQRFEIQEGVTTLPITFRYAVITEEWPLPLPPFFGGIDQPSVQSVSVGCGSPTRPTGDQRTVVGEEALNTALTLSCDVLGTTAVASTSFDPQPSVSVGTTATWLNLPNVQRVQAFGIPGIAYEIHINEKRGAPTPGLVSFTRQIPLAFSFEGQAAGPATATSGVRRDGFFVLFRASAGPTTIAIDETHRFGSRTPALISFNILCQTSASFLTQSTQTCQGTQTASVRFDQAEFDRIMGDQTFPLAEVYALQFSGEEPIQQRIPDDTFGIALQKPDGSTIALVPLAPIDSLSLFSFPGIDLPGGDLTVGWTGWKTVCKKIPVAPGAASLQLFVQEDSDSDSLFDTVLLIDEVQFREVGPCD